MISNKNLIFEVIISGATSGAKDPILHLAQTQNKNLQLLAK